MTMTDVELEQAFNLNENQERSFAEHFLLDGYSTSISIEQGDVKTKSITLQNLITGPAPYLIGLNGEEENLGVSCDLLITVRLDRQDEGEEPDIKEINYAVSKLMVKGLRRKLRAGVTIQEAYTLPVESWQFRGVDHALDEDNRHDLVTLVYSYNLYINAE